MAPEVVKYEPYTELVDIYSFGILLWQCATGLNPYSRLDKDSFMQRVVQDEERPPLTGEYLNVVVSISPALCTVLQSCWCHDWTQRVSASTAHAMLQDIKASIPKRFCYF